MEEKREKREDDNFNKDDEEFGVYIRSGEMWTTCDLLQMNHV